MNSASFCLLVAAVMATIAAVDLHLGARAEYLNAHAILLALAGGGGEPELPLFLGSERFAPGPRLLLGIALWTAEALVIAVVLALPLHLFGR